MRIIEEKCDSKEELKEERLQSVEKGSVINLAKENIREDLHKKQRGNYKTFIDTKSKEGLLTRNAKCGSIAFKSPTTILTIINKAELSQGHKEMKFIDYRENGARTTTHIRSNTKGFKLDNSLSESQDISHNNK